MKELNVTLKIRDDVKEEDIEIYKEALNDKDPIIARGCPRHEVAVIVFVNSYKKVDIPASCILSLLDDLRAIVLSQVVSPNDSDKLN